MGCPDVLPETLQSTICGWPDNLFFRGRSLDTIERNLQQAVNAIHEWATRNGFKFASQRCKVINFTAPRSRVQRPLATKIGNIFLPMEDLTKFLGLWWDPRLSFKKHISVLKTTVPGGSEPYPSGRSLEVGSGQRHTFDAVLGHCMLQASRGAFQKHLWALKSKSS